MNRSVIAATLILGSLLAVPASAADRRSDFDGDGKADISVFRPSTGVW